MAEELNDVAITIDVEWAADEVIDDVRSLLDERGIAATFFCTHAGIDVPGHERALHPNFRRSRNTLAQRIDAGGMDDRDFYSYIIRETKAFCPEAVGTRSHSLFTESDLFSICRDAGLEYDSSMMLPLAPNLSPVLRGAGILELPAYYMDHWDLSETATDFRLEDLRLDEPGMKIMVFHPNLIFMNSAGMEGVTESKPYYHDVNWLHEHRGEGRGVRTLFVELLDSVAAGWSKAPRLDEVNAQWRAANSPAR